MNIKIKEIYFKILPRSIMKYHDYRIKKFVEYIVFHYDKFDSKKILDVGAHNSPYKKYFKRLKYYALDVTSTKEGVIDIVSDLNIGLGIKNESFDFILCTQVLEHVKEPHKAFREFNRVLKQGGRVFLTTPFCWGLHMIPNDFFRYTQYGLRYLAELNGFHVESINPHGGVFSTLTGIFETLIPNLFFKECSLLYYLYYVIFTIPIFLLNSILLLLDNLDRRKILTSNYECVFRKYL